MSLLNYLKLLKAFFPIFLYSLFKEDENLKLSQGERIEIQAGSLSSKKSIIPFGYNKLEICHPKKNDKIYSLGEIITGEELFSTDYFASINENKYCQNICQNEFKDNTINLIKKLIKREYYTNWYIDNLPAGLLIYNSEKKKYNIDYFKGIPLGFMDKKDKKFYIYNHLQFHILINKIEDNKFNIVGFNILPLSIKYGINNDDKCIFSKDKNDYLSIKESEKQELIEGNITFKYDTIFEISSIDLKTRWDNYKKNNIIFRWAGLIYSNLLIIIFSIITFIIFSKNVKNEIDAYNYRVVTIESFDEFNWKQLSGDIFRAPSKRPMLLSALIGTGIQLFLMACVSLFLGIFTYMSPESGINLINFLIISFFILGSPAGYISTKFYRFFGGSNWVKISLLTSLLFPGSIMIMYFIIDITLVIEKSNAAIHIKNILTLFCLWIFWFTPLTLFGSFFAAKEKKKEPQYIINYIPTLIPKKPFYLSVKFSPFITGLICFGAIFFELNYIMNSLWKNETYFLATFLWISLFVFIVINGEITILVIYWNLTKGDYNWWWKSFFLGASPLIYLFLYSIYYLFTLKITRISAFIVYFGIMNLIYIIAFFICGSLSTVMSYFFLIKLYKHIKID